MVSKKAIGPVVATSLLIVVAVVAIVTFQTWFSTFSSGLYTSIESTGSETDYGVERVIGDTLYFDSNKDNLTIDKVEVNGVDCGISGDYNNSMHSLDISSCLDSSQNGKPSEVVVFTEEGIIAYDFLQNFEEPTYFISSWNTSLSGSSASNQIQLPLESSGSYDFIVTGETLVGSPVIITDYTDNILNFTVPGVHEIKITGEIDGWRFNNGGDRQKILEISNWGPLKLGNSNRYFSGAANLQITATDILDTSEITDMSYAFSNSPSITTIPSINSWDMSSVENMSNMFSSSSNFDQPINNWDTSSVTDMEYMFSYASNFNQPLDNWDTSNVVDMYGVFSGASSFNGSLNSWDTSNVITMRSMFTLAGSFDRDISDWDVNKVESMERMFYLASVFNQNISDWNTSSVIDMDNMFQLAGLFNQNLSSWDVDQVGTECSDFDNGASSWTLPKPNLDPSCLS